MIQGLVDQPHLRVASFEAQVCNLSACPPHSLIAAGGYFVISGDLATCKSIKVLFVWRYSARGMTAHWVVRDFPPSPCSSQRTLTFLPGRSTLLVPDDSAGCVHMLDAEKRIWLGHMAGARAFCRPICVSASADASAPKVAVLCSDGDSDGGMIVDFLQEDVHAGSAASGLWRKMHSFSIGKSWLPRICLSHHGDLLGCALHSEVYFLDALTGQPMGSRTKFVPKHLPVNLVSVQDGWLVVCRGKLAIMHADGRSGLLDVFNAVEDMQAVAMVPGFGLFVLRSKLMHQELRVFSTPDLMAMADMSQVRVAWMTAVFSSTVVSI
jgi:hypothetical protein